MCYLAAVQQLTDWEVETLEAMYRLVDFKASLVSQYVLALEKLTKTRA